MVGYYSLWERISFNILGILLVGSFVLLGAFHQAFAQSSNAQSSDFNFDNVSFSIWLSEGKTTLGHHTSLARNHPTSVLENEDQTWFLDITRKKRFYRGKNVLDARFNFGISFFDDSATFDDKDFCSGTTAAADLNLSITDCGDLTLWSHTIDYGNLSGGYFFGDIFAAPKRTERTWFKKPLLIQITPFFGAGVILEDYIYHDTASSLYLVYLRTGTLPSPSNLPVIRHNISWSVARLGGEMIIKPKNEAAKNWTARFEASFVPLGHFRNEDSHFFRSSLGPVPNIIDESSTVSGYQFSADMEYRLPRHQKTAFFIGYRLDDLLATGTSSFGPNFNNFSPANFTRKRSGVVLGFRKIF